MAVYNLYSKRQKRLSGEQNEIFTYASLPEPLKNQIVFIINDAMGEDKYANNTVKSAYKYLHHVLCREYGKVKLIESSNYSDKENILNALLWSDDIGRCLDIVELLFKFIDTSIRNNENHYSHGTDQRITPDDAISELNARFKEHAIGFQFAGGELIRLDSTYIHQQVTLSSINLLSKQRFKGANEEFLKAHEHYRHGRNKECLNECLKAFESTMKIICQEKNWQIDPIKDTAKKLIQVCFQNGVVPTYTQNQFTSLQNLLESGIPTIRNKLGGHGQGSVPQKVDDEMTRYALNLTGANVIFLIEQSGL